MNLPRLAEDLITDQELSSDLEDVLTRRIAQQRPLVVTHAGKAAAVLISPAMFDAWSDQQQVVQDVLRGLSDVANGDLVDDEAVWAELEPLFADQSR